MNIGTICAVIGFAFYTEWNRRKTATKVNEVVSVVLPKLEEIRKQGNSVLGEHLHTVSLLTERIAMTTNEVGDMRRAEEALTSYQKHTADQAQLAKDKQAIAVATAAAGGTPLAAAEIIASLKPGPKAVDDPALDVILKEQAARRPLPPLPGGP